MQPIDFTAIKPKRDTVVSTRIPAEYYAQLQEIAEKYSISICSVARTIITHYLDEVYND